MKYTIPFQNGYRQYLSIKKEIDASVRSVIKLQSFIRGPFVTEFENNVASYCGTKYAVSLNSGTDALYLALWSLGITKGDEVITSSYSFFATAEVICHLGAKPVFVDITPDSFCINPEKIEKSITQKTKAIIPVHLFGFPCQMKAIRSIAKRHQLSVIEDACQALGATYLGKKVGNLGNIGCFSFFPTKNLGAYGDGGLLTTNNRRVADTVRLLANHGSVKKYRNVAVGINSRLDGIQAAVLLAKLPHLNAWQMRRNEIAQLYQKNLSDLVQVICPAPFKGGTHAFHQYTVRIMYSKRNRLQHYLLNRGIQTAVYYPIPLHLLPALKFLGYKNNDFPEAERASREALSLPIYPELTDKEVYHICLSIRKYFGK